MNLVEALEEAKEEFIGREPIITSLIEAEYLHDKLVKLRTHLKWVLPVFEFMPHYRAE